MKTNQNVIVLYSCGFSERYDSYYEAIAEILKEYPDAVIGHDGDLAGGGPYTLVWCDELDAENDDGANAMAKIVLAKGLRK